MNAKYKDKILSLMVPGEYYSTMDVTDKISSPISRVRIISKNPQERDSQSALVFSVLQELFYDGYVYRFDKAPKAYKSIHKSRFGRFMLFSKLSRGIPTKTRISLTRFFSSNNPYNAIKFMIAPEGVNFIQSGGYVGQQSSLGKPSLENPVEKESRKLQYEAVDLSKKALYESQRSRRTSKNVALVGIIIASAISLWVAYKPDQENEVERLNNRLDSLQSQLDSLKNVQDTTNLPASAGPAAADTTGRTDNQ